MNADNRKLFLNRTCIICVNSTFGLANKEIKTLHTCSEREIPLIVEIKMALMKGVPDISALYAKIMHRNLLSEILVLVTMATGYSIISGAVD